MVLDHHRSGDFSRTGAFFKSHAESKAALDYVGLRSGDFGQTGTFFSSQTKANVVLNQDGLRSGRIVASLHPTLAVLDHNSLTSGDIESVLFLVAGRTSITQQIKFMSLYFFTN